MTDLLAVTLTAYETQAYETLAGAKTFRLAQKTYGSWEVTSHNTKQPLARCFWGCKTFLTLQEVSSHYKAFRGIDKLLAN